MFAVSLFKNDVFVKLIGFVNSHEEVENIFDMFVRKYGAEWLGANGYDFKVELAI